MLAMGLGHIMTFAAFALAATNRFYTPPYWFAFFCLLGGSAAISTVSLLWMFQGPLPRCCAGLALGRRQKSGSSTESLKNVPMKSF